jgi:N-acetylneuraminic acid mutarotase
LGEKLPKHRKALRRSAALTGAALGVVLAMASLTTGAASAATPQPGTSTATSGIVPNVAPVTNGALSQVCSAPKQAGLASCLAIRDDKGRTGLGVRHTAATAPSGYGPSQLLSAYDLPANGGEGATIAIVDAYDDPNAEADLAVYREQFGLPALAPGQFRKVNQEGAPDDYPVANASWGTEISLDLDMVSAIAPRADIILVEANSDAVSDLGAAVNEAVSLGASYVSNSYGGGETSGDPQLAAEYFDHPGVAVVASAGDSGYGVQFPAASPNVTAVGGTTLTPAPGTARGWTETVWGNGESGTDGDGTGSGCSQYEPKPSFQTDTGCANRTVADVSADANPDTGVAVYDTYSGINGYTPGWGQYGGTSVASPIITATYVLGGPIAAGSYPNHDPYAHTADLNNVTSGSNGTCSPAYLCTGGPGYNGPTGLGTPAGTGAFTDTSYGTLTGTVTSATGKPVAGAQIRLTGPVPVTTTTQADGSYQVRLPAGGYSVAVTAYGYAAAPATGGVSITVGGTTVRSVQLKADPQVTVSGTVTDGSGHGWPVESSVLLDYGTGTVATSTNPYTGRYSLRVPGDSSYQVQVTPQLTGYQTMNTSLTLGGSDGRHDFTVDADLLASEGSAPGYRQYTTGTAQTFANGTLPAGWNVTTASGTPWTFVNGAATVYLTNTAPTDTSLYAPPVSVPAGRTPVVSFSTSQVGGLAEVDMTTDGGTTWQTAWSSDPGSYGFQTVEFTLPSAGTARTFQFRFRYQAYDQAASAGFTWELTHVLLGAAWLTPAPGGLVEGTVTDANTGARLDGANVAVTGQPDSAATTAAMTGPGDGFYYLFAPAGRQALTGTLLNYGPGKKAVNVAADKITRGSIVMPAGRLAASGTISATSTSDGTATRTITLTNTGDYPATFAIDQFPGTGAGMADAAMMPAGTTAPQARTVTANPGGGETIVQRLRAARDGNRQAVATSTVRHDLLAGTAATSPGPAWSVLPDMPSPTYEGVAAAYDGREYEGLGAITDSLGLPATSSHFYSYDQATGAWTQEASAPDPVAQGGYAVIGDKLYATGCITGADLGLKALTTTQVYDFTTNTWSQAAADPYGICGTDVVVGGDLYQIGGNDSSTLALSDTVSVYDPSTNTWSQAPSYPVADDALACGVIAGTVYCAGGDGTSAYAYTPGDAAWRQISSLPIPLSGGAFGVANGELLISGGESAFPDFSTAGYKYNPAMNWWVPLPAAPIPQQFAAGTVGTAGFYTFGGMTFTAAGDESAVVLSGYSQAGPVSLPWLSLSQTTGTIQPGHSVTITVRLNAAKAGLSGSGTVSAALGFETGTPYEVTPVKVSLTVG